MATFKIKAAANVRELDAGKMEAHLNAQGVATDGVSVQYDSADDVFIYHVETSVDPTDVVQSYVKQPTPQDVARLALRDLRSKFRARTATPTEVRDAVGALIELLGE